MGQWDAEAEQLWLVDQRVRGTLIELEITEFDGLDAAREDLRRAQARDPRVDVGFLGRSQVGKSTLINAIVGSKVLPSGGVGPLTAQATRLEWSQTPQLAVRYHGRQRLNQFRFAIEAYLRRRGELPEGDEAEESEELTEAATRVLLDSQTEDGQSSQGNTGESMLRQGLLMFFGRDGAATGVERLAVLDAVRMVLGLRPVGSPQGAEALTERIGQIRARLGESEAISVQEVGGEAFKQQLSLRAAGWLAPLVEDLTLTLNDDVLKDLVIVDLPGIGVVGDPAGHVAEEFVSRDADALVVVEMNSGLTHEVATVLERTQVISKLLFGGQDEASPIHVLYAITNLDRVARDHWESEVQRAVDAGAEPPAERDVFHKRAAEMEREVKRQIAEALRTSPSFEELPDEVRRKREEIVGRLIEEMEVVCVVATDYMSLRSTIPAIQKRAFLQSIEDTNIPRFLASLHRLRDRAIARRDQEVRDAIGRMRTQLRAQIESAIDQFRDDGTRAFESEAALRGRLEGLYRELRDAMLGHHAETMTRLQEVIPRDIRDVVNEAAETARKRLRRLLREGERPSMHYRSLNAALLRDGRFDKRNIDFPGQLIGAVVDTVAAQWEPRVIEPVRTVVGDIARRDGELVCRLLASAAEVSGGAATAAVIRRHQRLLEVDAARAIASVKDQLEALRDDARSGLHAAVARPIERACQRAVNAEANIGTGAKARILEAFEVGGENAIGEAQRKAVELLQRRYDEMIGRLHQGYLREHYDPLTRAYDAVIQDAVGRAREADGALRAEARRRLTEVLATVAGGEPS